MSVIETKRLQFKEFQKEDFPLFASVFTNEEVMRYAWIDAFQKEADCAAFFEEVLENKKKEDKRLIYEYGVYNRESGAFMGFACLESASRNEDGGMAELGYFFLPEFWGAGYATETAKRLLQLAFEELGFHKVTARCHEHNKNSENLMRKVGMIKEGELRKARYKKGMWYHEPNYGILREEYFKN